MIGTNDKSGRLGMLGVVPILLQYHKIVTLPLLKRKDPKLEPLL